MDATVRALFRRGNPAARGKPGRTATIRRDGGWFGGADRAPDVPLDEAVLTPADHSRYVAALSRTGFAGPDSWYLNHAANAAYAARAPDGGRLAMPVLFLHGAYDTTCETMDSDLAAADAAGLRRPDRGGGAVRPLDGAGAAGGGECGTRPLARAARAAPPGRAECRREKVGEEKLASSRHCATLARPALVCSRETGGTKAMPPLRRRALLGALAASPARRARGGILAQPPGPA